MTVCIAALYENGQGCLLASDQMTTAHFPIGYEFESQEVEKIIRIAESSYILAAGDVLFAHAVVEEARTQLEDGVILPVSRIADAVRTAYQNVRKKYLVHTQLEPRGLDLNSYYSAHQKLLPGLVQMIDQQFAGHNPGVDLIVAGRDNTGCHVYSVQNPGRALSHDPVGFVAIGSGAPHAIYSLIESGYNKTLDRSQVGEMVETAKARSEVAPGVGEATTTEEISPVPDG